VNWSAEELIEVVSESKARSVLSSQVKNVLVKHAITAEIVWTNSTASRSCSPSELNFSTSELNFLHKWAELFYVGVSLFILSPLQPLHLCT
jgi:hypothetical protein